MTTTSPEHRPSALIDGELVLIFMWAVHCLRMIFASTMLYISKDDSSSRLLAGV